MRFGALVSCRRAYERIGDLASSCAVRGLGLLHRAGHDRSGATAIEYALIASLISIAIIGSLTFFSSGVSDMFNNVSNTLQSNI